MRHGGGEDVLLHRHGYTETQPHIFHVLLLMPIQNHFFLATETQTRQSKKIPLLVLQSRLDLERRKWKN